MKLKVLRSGIAKAPGLQVRQLETTERTRGSTLQAIRQRWFAAHPLCVACDKLGRVTAVEELDHIIELADGGADDDTNRQGLCKPCHQAKTDAARADRARDRRGW